VIHFNLQYILPCTDRIIATASQLLLNRKYKKMKNIS